MELLLSIIIFFMSLMFILSLFMIRYHAFHYSFLQDENQAVKDALI